MTELPAGRESDRKIAGRLGLEIKDIGGHLFAVNRELREATRLPRYTTDLSAAWSLIDGYYSVELSMVRSPTSNDELHQIIFKPWNPNHDAYWTFQASAPYLPLAVCRAWWACMDAKEEKHD